MVAVRLSQPEQPHHRHGTAEIEDGCHLGGLLVRAWYHALCRNVAEERRRPAQAGAIARESVGTRLEPRK
jgi:hypothetical protein